MSKLSEVILRDAAVSRPAAGIAGRLFYDTTNEKFQRDTGAAWEDCEPVAGAISTDAIWDAAGDLAIGTGANTAGRLAVGTANQVLRVNAGATAPEWADVGRVLISEQTPTGTSVSFTSIPATYKHLVIEYIARSTRAANVYEYAALRFNNDTTDANYRRTLTEAYAASTHTVLGGDDSLFCEFPAANSPANSATTGEIRINFYATTTFNKSANLIETMRMEATTNHQIARQGGIEWENTAAITRVDLVLASGGSFVAGSTFRLYGEF